jgi:S1-C subfamily serine protease
VAPQLCRPLQAALVLLAILCLQGRAAAATDVDPFVEVVARTRNSVVAIGSYQPNDAPTAMYFGTGFVVNDGQTVATNQHVVAAIRQTGRLNAMRVFFPNQERVEGWAAVVLAEDAFHDVALLRFQGPAASPLTLTPEVEPRQGQGVGIIGYPIGMRLGVVPAVHRGVVAAVVPAVLPLPKGAKLTPQLAEALRRPYNLYQLDLVVFPGNSGSPLLDARSGAVLGIINKTLASRTREHLLSEPSGISYAVPALWIHELLVRSLKPQLSDSDKPLPSGGK